MAEALTKSPSSPDEAGLWFQNRGLFSDHFLKARLPQWKEWETDEELATFRKELMSLYESTKPILPTLNEAQTEKEFIQPLLDLLGYANSYIVQAPTKVGQQTNRPDYALFPDGTTKNKAYQKLKGNDYTQCIGIADAKYWERELDLAKSSDRDTYTNQNPSFQIVSYLTGTQQKWGILTNGCLWRLYCIKSHLPLGNYYQVDLVQLLEEAPEEQFKYFYLFFRKASLLQVDGKSFLDHVLEGSNEYAVELEANIKERAYEVVELLCRGFAAGFSKKQLAELALKDIYDNSLTLLYRLLFVFYAEARELLPLTTSVSYHDNYSMRKITHDIDEVIRKGQQLTSQSSIYYQRIGSLFGLINTGDPGLGVPEYNGGLFDHEEHPFLEEHAIADAHLVPAIQQLAQVYDKELKRVVAVDYNTLSERHLGSIYEGLLEFKPRTAPHDLVTMKEKSSIKYAPASKYSGKEIAYKKGELYLADDKGERKASGSYYTPEYIVNYIVENTLAPLVKEVQNKLKALKPEVDKATAKWQKLKEQKQGLEPTDKYDRKTAEERGRLLEPYLSLKVLDPAMGSGHFLARATDFLAEAIATDPSIESPVELTEESELTYYRRRVVESCIYGVDLNPLAVELAKLTLWLGTMAKSKPLSFLNHHLRVGNSLIGANVANLDEIPKRKGKRGKPFDTSRAPVQLGIFQEAFNKKLYDLLQNRALIAQLPTETLEDVRNKEKWERDFEHDAERFRTLADLWVSTYFDNNVRWDEYNALVENLQSTQPEWEKLLKKENVKRALAMSEEKHFFHWELEFPEVFYDEQGNRKADAGFDAVTGNPPYAILGNYGEFEPYFSLNYQSAKYKADSYMLFVEKGLNLVRSNGLFSQIFPNKFCLTTSGKGLRQFLMKHRIEGIVDFGTSQIFEGAINYVMIPIIRHAVHEFGEYTFHYRQITKGFGKTVAEFDVSSQSLFLDGWQFAPTKSRSLLEKIGQYTDSLGELADSIFAGVQTGDDEIMIVKRTAGKQRQLEPQLLRKFLRGRNIDRYEITWEDGYLIYPYDANGDPLSEELMKSKYPKTWDYLKLHESDLRKRIWFGKGPEELSGAWYGLMYFPEKDLFDRIKLLCPYLSQNTSYSMDEEGSLFGVGAGYGIFLKDSVPLNIFYVLCQLNSKLCSYRFKQISPEFQAGYKNNEVYIRQLPIRRINFTTPEEELKQLLEQGKKLYQEYLHSQNWDKVIAFVAQCLPQKVDGTPDTEHEQSDVVHGLLAFLAEEMTRLNKEKQAKIKDFLNWLEKEILKGSVEDQKNKTKIKGFHESSFEDLLDILKKNKTVPDPCSSNTRDTISGEFSAAMNVVVPIKARVKATDNLIDQIVYRLYGLTDDEITIVEGQKS